MKKYILFILFIGFFASCEEKASLEEQVMAIHDEAMPRMGEVNAAKKEMRALLSQTKDSATVAEIIDIIDYLDAADEGMYAWMDAYKLPQEEAKKKSYLQRELKKVNKVKLDIDESIKQANEYLKNHK